MKTLFAAAVFIFIFAALASSSFAQSKKTIILVRHAEKETSAAMDNGDPPLSPEGVKRAEKLRKLAGKYRPGAIYSTDYKRTRATVEPIAKKRHLEVEIYDAKNSEQLIERIMKSRTKRVIIVGHSNTIPALVNLLTKKELFKNLDDAEYGTVWVVRLRDGQLRKAEILPY
jgi:broad specificity phosphatase PhoE